MVDDRLLSEVLVALIDKRISAQVQTKKCLKKYGKDDTLTQLYYKEYKEAKDLERRLDKVLFPCVYH